MITPVEVRSSRTFHDRLNAAHSNQITRSLTERSRDQYFVDVKGRSGRRCLVLVVNSDAL